MRVYGFSLNLLTLGCGIIMSDRAIETRRNMEADMNIAQAYERVNTVQPIAPVAPLTIQEAERALKKMYRHLTGDKLSYRVVETSGNRYTWVRGGEWRVNTSRGWDGLIHSFSHWYFGRHIGGKPHSKAHARLEMKLRKRAISLGWMTGSLRGPDGEPEIPPSKNEIRDALIVRRMAQVSRLERKIKALTTRLKTAKRSLGALQRVKMGN